MHLVCWNGLEHHTCLLLPRQEERNVCSDHLKVIVGNGTDILEICYTWTSYARGDELMES